MGLVIRSKIGELRRKKEYEENRDLPLRTMAAETGLSLNTVQRLVKGETGRVYLSTLDTLCKYFRVQSVADLIEFVPDTSEGETGTA